jgi:hypothetical protein
MHVLLSLALPFSYPCEFELGTARLLEHELITGEFHQVNGRREWRLNFDSILIAKFIPAANFSDEHRAIAQKFPNCLIFTSRHSPFADDGGIPAAGQNEKQNYRGGDQRQTRALMKIKSHQLEL